MKNSTFQPMLMSAKTYFKSIRLFSHRLIPVVDIFLNIFVHLEQLIREHNNRFNVFKPKYLGSLETSSKLGGESPFKRGIRE